MKFRELAILVMLVVMSLIFEAINPAFLSLANVQVLLRSSAFIGIMAVGIAVLLISGMIDISIGAIAGLAAIVTSYLMVRGWATIPAIGVGLLAGALAGYINSLLVLRFKLIAFLATIATMYVFRGLAETLSNGYTIYPLPSDITIFGQAQPLGVSWQWWIFLGLIVVVELILRNTIWGLTVKATGSDREIAFMTEVNVNRVNTQTFIICGVLAALSGILLMARIASGDPTTGQGWELQAITAAAIGGVSLLGYEGSMLGVLLGVLLIQVVQNGLVSIGGSAYLQPIEIGVVLVVSAVYDITRRRKLNF
jgi:ribose transport system permease protein